MAKICTPKLHLQFAKAKEHLEELAGHLFF